MRWLCFWRPPCVLKTVIVNLSDDPSTALQGVLWAVRGPWLTLRDAAVLKGGLPPTRTDGEVIVHRSNVSFLQVVP
jgi:hypothetical protein